MRVPNRALWVVTGVTLALLGLAVYLPGLAQLFYFAPLQAPHALLAVAIGLSGVVWFESIKRVWRKSTHPAKAISA